MTLETLIQFRRHWKAVDMLLEREIAKLQDEPKPMKFVPGDVIINSDGEVIAQFKPKEFGSSK